MAVYKTEIDGNFLIITEDGTRIVPPFNASWTHIVDLTDTTLVLEDGGKGDTKEVYIPLAEYFETDGTTAIDTQAKVITWLKDKIG